MTTAFVFSGESAKIGAQAGIALALAAKGIEPDACYGTSSGALAAVACSYIGVEGLAEICRKITSISDVFTFNWKFLWSNGLFTAAPIKKMLNKFVVGKGKIPAIVTVVDAVKGTLEYHSSFEATNADFIKYCLGAISIAGVVNPETPYIDGASAADAPASQAIKDGHDKIVVILGTPPIPHATLGAPILTIGKVEFLGFVKYFARFAELLLNQVMFDDLLLCLSSKAEVRVFGPKEFLFGPLDFSQTASAVSSQRDNYVEWVYLNGAWTIKS